METRMQENNVHAHTVELPEREHSDIPSSVYGSEDGFGPFRRKMRRIRTALFPFFVFRYPESRPKYAYGHQRESLAESTLKVFFPVDETTGKLPKIFLDLVRFSIMLVVAMLAVLFFVYVCFSFNADSTFPTIGNSLYWWLAGRNIILILLLRHVCFVTCRPNRERLKLLTFDLEKIDPDLKYLGVFHSSRRFICFILRIPFKLRWFTTFLSDCLLLGIMYVSYVIYELMLLADRSSVASAVSELSNLYRSFLLFGFIAYTLEFAPKVPECHSYMFKGVVFFNVAMNLCDFFLFVNEKQGQTGIQRAFGAGAQLFITHSCVLLSAIAGGHHHHAHVSPDLPFKGLWKLAVVFLLSGVWFTYSLLKDRYGYDLEGEYNQNWIPKSYAYVLWGINIGGGIICTLFAVAYCFGKRNFAFLLRLGNREAKVIDGSAEPANEKEEEEENSALDFDIILIVLTYLVSCVYYSSEMYGFYSLGEYTAMAYWITAPIAPGGLAIMTAIMWRKPPNRSKFALFFGLFLATIWLITVEFSEDCHLNSDVPTCCEYPWTSDVNHHYEEPNEAPICTGLIRNDGTCLVNIFDVTPSSSTEFFSSITLIFDAVTDTTRGVSVSGVKNGVPFMSVTDYDVSNLIQTTTCRDHDYTTPYFWGTPATIEAGCYGQYYYRIPHDYAIQCSPALYPNTVCEFSVVTLNCAFIASEELVFEATVLTDLNSTELSGIDLDAHVNESTDKVESIFYTVFKTIGMAALLECFFTLFGVLLKLIFLTECKTEHTEEIRGRQLSKKVTVVFEVEPEPDDDENAQDEIPPDEGGVGSGTVQLVSEVHNDTNN